MKMDAVKAFKLVFEIGCCSDCPYFERINYGQDIRDKTRCKRNNKEIDLDASSFILADHCDFKALSELGFNFTSVTKTGLRVQ